MYKLGIDVGGTNTDAVLIDENLNVIADIKHPTSSNIYDGILGALRKVLEVSGVDRSQIRQAMLGTTQCTNAIVERKTLPGSLSDSHCCLWTDQFHTWGQLSEQYKECYCDRRGWNYDRSGSDPENNTSIFYISSPHY